MHELSLCQSIIEIINQYVSEKENPIVKKITLEIGQLTGIDDSALRFSFDVITKGTVAEGAILEIMPIEGRAVCDTCQKIVILKNYYDPCENCSQFSSTIIQGNELRVKSMEVG